MVIVISLHSFSLTYFITELTKSTKIYKTEDERKILLSIKPFTETSDIKSRKTFDHTQLLNIVAVI